MAAPVRRSDPFDFTIAPDAPGKPVIGEVEDDVGLLRVLFITVTPPMTPSLCFVAKALTRAIPLN